MAEMQEYQPVTTSITTPDVQVSSQSIESRLGSLASQRVSIKEAKQIVAAEGACQALDSISINPTSLRDNQKVYFKPEELEMLSPVIDRGEAKSSELKPHLGEVLNNEFLLDKFATGSLSKEVLQQQFRALQAPQIDRMFFILNHNIDPELIPFTFAGMALRQRDIPQVFINHLSNNEYSRRRLAILLSSPVYMDNLAGLKSHDRQPYPPDLLDDIHGFMNNCLVEISRNPKVTKEQTLSLREYLLKFFNVEREEWTGTLSVGSFSSALSDVTKSTYFESSYKDSVGGKRKSPLIGAVAVKDFIPKYRESAETAKYLATLYKRVKDIYAGAFPQIYVEPNVKGIKMTDPRPTNVYGESSSEGYVSDANGTYDLSDRLIVIESGTVIKRGGVKAFDEETTSLYGSKARRRIVDPVITAHEFTHAIYDKLIFGDKSSTLPNNYHETADHAINEGFAVMMELLFIDVLKANPGLMDLSAWDIVDLEMLKRDRLFGLKKSKNGYTEGTYRILHKVYSEAAGKGGKRDMNAGLAAIRQFVTALDPDRTLHILRTSKEYKDLLKKGDPVEWTRFFSQPQESVA